MLADPLTKGLPPKVFQGHVAKMVFIKTLHNVCNARQFNRITEIEEDIESFSNGYMLDTSDEDNSTTLGDMFDSQNIGADDHTTRNYDEDEEDSEKKIMDPTIIQTKMMKIMSTSTFQTEFQFLDQSAWIRMPIYPLERYYEDRSTS
ncbi:hypothetical protein Tco_0811331 [Tanacetum coccineum]